MKEGLGLLCQAAVTLDSDPCRLRRSCKVECLLTKIRGESGVNRVYELGGKE